MANYIFQVVLFQLLFLVVYQLWLRKETFFNYNRWYLLGVTALALVLPFIKIQIFNRVIPQQIMAQLPAIFIGGNPINNTNVFETSIFIENTNTSFEINYFLFWVIGMCMATLYFSFKLYKLYQLQQKSTKLKQEGYVLVQLQNSTDAFSFFKHIFLGNQLTQNQQNDILKHEKTHVKQWHSADLLWFELLRIVFWFNPLVYIYQKQITEVHEFIADKTVAKNKTQYYKNLLSQTFGVQQLSIINQFYSSSLIKKRIIMLTKQQSKSKKLVKYLSIIPLVIGMLFYVSCSVIKSNDKENEVITSEDSFSSIEIKVAADVPFSVVDKVPVFPGCDETTSAAILKKCFSQKIVQFVNENFNTKLAETTNLTGRQKIIVQFKIDKMGVIIDVKSRAPHALLKAEAERVIKALPKMKAGEYKGETVNVMYSLPIIFEVQHKNTVVEVETEVVDYTNQTDVPFSVVDKVPVFPGCDETTSAETLKKCFSQKIAQFVNENFNTKLAKTANLTGRQKILVLFKIDKTGTITDVKARAPHASLKIEAERVINSLPLMKAAEYNGKAVNVMYSLPIIFEVK